MLLQGQAAACNRILRRGRLNFAKPYGGYAISAFEGTPEDRELLKDIETLRQAGGSGSDP